MASGLTMMEHSFLPPRSIIWTSDSKDALQQRADLDTSVVVTRSIPVGACFGPCMLHNNNTFYDTIAFIALKSCDKRNKSYVFRVDPAAMRSAALVWSWLRLVQAARHREEQNAEAYLRAGQLYVRTTRHVRAEEELLVWYDQELSHLLGFTDMMTTTRGHNGEFKCFKCDQVFKNEHPFLAHCRFLCALQVRSEAWGREVTREVQVHNREVQVHRHVEVKRQRRVTDFHNIARDLEHKKPGTDEDADVSPIKKKKYDETVYPRGGRKSVLLEKTNISNDSNITHLTRDLHHPAAPEPVSVSVFKPKADKLKNDQSECKNGAFPEVGETTKGSFTHDKERPAAGEDRGPETGEGSGLHPTSSSAFSLVLSSGHGEQKSAFCKPSKRTSPTNDLAAHLPTPPAAPSGRLEEMANIFTPRAVLGYSNMLTSTMLHGELRGAQTLSTPMFHYAPEHWSRSIGAQQLPTPSSSSSLAILPPTFTSFGVSVQNWCAKCNLSFRMTSDLVFHMRSHHKKEFAVESQVRRRREDKLTCPICHEYFRERHHLSRHMTSHN